MSSRRPFLVSRTAKIDARVVVIAAVYWKSFAGSRIINTSTVAKRAAFRDLHRQGCFILPNPWDVGSARYLETLGFQALASTSSGFAWSHGYADSAMPLEAVLTHLEMITAATGLPLNADFEHGFADTPEGVAANVARACKTGIAGLSIEDTTKGVATPLFSIEDAVVRMRAARSAIDATGGDVLLVGRADGLFAGRDNMDEILARLRAYADAGADVLYAPGLTTEDQVSAVVRAVAPKPVNVLATPDFTVERLAALGVRRISVGGALARAAWAGFMSAAQEMAKSGSFKEFTRAASGRELNALMKS